MEENEITGLQMGCLSSARLWKRMRRDQDRVRDRECMGYGGKESEVKKATSVPRLAVRSGRVRRLLTQVALGTWGIVGAPYRAAVNVSPSVA